MVFGRARVKSKLACQRWVISRSFSERPRNLAVDQRQARLR